MTERNMKYITLETTAEFIGHTKPSAFGGIILYITLNNPQEASTKEIFSN